MNGRIVERISKQHAFGTFHLQEVDGRTALRFDSASPWGDNTRLARLVTDQQAKILIDRWPQAYRIADDLEQIEREKEMGEALKASKDTLMALIRDNADEIRQILEIDDRDSSDVMPFDKPRRGRPPLRPVGA